MTPVSSIEHPDLEIPLAYRSEKRGRGGTQSRWPLITDRSHQFLRAWHQPRKGREFQLPSKSQLTPCSGPRSPQGSSLDAMIKINPGGDSDKDRTHSQGPITISLFSVEFSDLDQVSKAQPSCQESQARMVRQ